MRGGWEVKKDGLLVYLLSRNSTFFSVCALCVKYRQKMEAALAKSPSFFSPFFVKAIGCEDFPIPPPPWSPLPLPISPAVQYCRKKIHPKTKKKSCHTKLSVKTFPLARSSMNRNGVEGEEG